jgi:hypothetical protein
VVRVIVVLVVGLALAGCSPPAGDEPDGGADSAADSTADEGIGCIVCGDATEELPDWVAVKDDIVRICSNSDDCHGSGAGGMGLSPGHVFDTMINVTSTENPPMKRVLPGDPEHSYVYLKVACEGGIVGDCMPNDAVHDPHMAQVFHDWIEAGAQTQ